MSNSTLVRFVGNQEGGRKHWVDDRVDHMDFHEAMGLDNVPFVGGEVNIENARRKVIRYVRRGDVMVHDALLGLPI